MSSANKILTGGGKTSDPELLCCHVTFNFSRIGATSRR